MKDKKYRPAIFCVVHTKDHRGRPRFLLLKRKLHWVGWEFPKGKIESREKMIETVVREVREETGIGIKKKDVVDHKISGKYKYNKKLEDRPQYIGQTYHLFSIDVKKIPRKVSFDEKEHSGYKWVSYLKALWLLSYGDQRKCLRIVKKWLKAKS